MSRRHIVVQKRSWWELVGFLVWCKRSLAHPNSLLWFRGCNHFTARGFLFNSVLIFNREVTLWSFAHLCSWVQGVWDTGSCNKREVFGSLVATTGTTLSFPHSELAGIHRRLKSVDCWNQPAVQLEHGTVLETKVGELTGAVSWVLVNPVS